MEPADVTMVRIFYGSLWVVLSVVFCGMFLVGREDGKAITWAEVIFVGIILFPGVAFVSTGVALKSLLFAIWNLFDKPIRKVKTTNLYLVRFGAEIAVKIRADSEEEAEEKAENDLADMTVVTIFYAMGIDLLSEGNDGEKDEGS